MYSRLPLLLGGLGVTILTVPYKTYIGTHWPRRAAISGCAPLRWSTAQCGRDGLGVGDAKLLAAAGSWLGLGALPLVVLLAALVGLAFAGIAAATGRAMLATSTLPFGAFLAASIWLVWLYGPMLPLP